MMKVEITEVGGTKKEMKVMIPSEEVNSVTDGIYRDIAQGVAIKGFRKGKAPRHIIKMYYQEYITGELSRKLVREKFEEAVKEQNLFVVSMPEFENDEPREQEDFTFSAKFDVKPEITPQVYTGFELKKPKIAVEDRNVDEVIGKLQETYASIKDVEDATYQAVQGDYVILSITCEENDTLNRDKITVEAGVRSAFPGLEKEVLGLKTSDEKEVDVSFPETHFLEDMRGKTARVKINVHGIKLRELARLDDEFAKMVHKGVQTVEELKKAIREDLVSRLEAEARSYMERQISEKLLEANTFDVPESMVRLQAIMMLQGMSQRLSAQGVRLQDIYPDGDALREESMASAEKLVKTSLLVEAIAKINAIESTDEDVEKEIDSLAEKYSMTPEAVRQNFEERGGLDEMKYGILERKVFDHIVERSTLVEVESMEEKTA
ncbi:MAG TPA: trigger factor [Desulfomonilia bacterium]|nr:trigger factor [Desulfomonilia bacterium]